MTVSAINIESVRASVDLALQELHDSLRQVNHEVSLSIETPFLLFTLYHSALVCRVLHSLIEF